MGVSVLIRRRLRRIRLLNRDSHLNLIGRIIRVSHNNRNSDLVTRLSVLRNGNGDLTSVLINLHTLRSILTRGELGALWSVGRLAVLVLELRLLNLDVLARLTRTILVARLELGVLVRNLRVAVILIRDAVAVVVLVLGVRLTVVIGIQLELCLRIVLAAVRVGHRDRNFELLNGVLAQLGLIREGHRDLTGVLIDLDLVALRSLEVLRNSKLGALGGVNLFLGRVALGILASLGERRGGLGLLTRNNQLLFVSRLVLVRCLVGYKNRPCCNVVIARDNNNVVDVALLGILWDVEGARGNLVLSGLRLVELAGLSDLAVLVTPFNLRWQSR